MRTPTIAIAASTAALALLAGCGGGSSSTSTQAATTSSSTTTTSADPAAAFKRKLDSALMSFEATAKDTVAELSKAPSQSGADASVRLMDLKTHWQNGLQQLEGLNGPTSAESAYAATTSAAASVNTDFLAVATYAIKNDPKVKAAAIKLIQDMAAVKSAAQKLEAALG
jgi:hypothetical protein